MGLVIKLKTTPCPCTKPILLGLKLETKATVNT